MTTLLLRLAAPMQSWGTQSRFTVRDTGLEPSKSGVIGLLCAALGRPRHQSVDDLARLRMGVRVDREGWLRMDYHTAGGVHRNGERYGVAVVDDKDIRTMVSRRYYLADADFLVGLEETEDDDDLLIRLHDALKQPHWQLYLGRKSFPPAVPPWIPDGLLSGIALEDALASYPWHRGFRAGSQASALRLVVEVEAESGEEVRLDQPFGAAFLTRTFGPRYVATRLLEIGTEVPIAEE